LLSLLEPALQERYQDLVEIGRGGMGRVYRGFDRKLQRAVAIKVLSTRSFEGGEARERFLEEGRICSQLQHPHIVHLYDFGAPKGEFAPYMIFEFIEGISLHQRFHEGPLETSEALNLLIGIGDGLAFAHEAGIVHRDLKPENILLHKRSLAKVADFGLAKDSDSSSGVRTQEGLLLGTPPYMAPEYIRSGDTGPSVDLYAFGILAYQMLVGQLPFNDPDDTQILRAHVQKAPPNPRSLAPHLDEELCEWILRALAKKPADRFPTLRHLVRLLQGQQEELRSSSPRRSRPRPRKASRLHDRSTLVHSRFVTEQRGTARFASRKWLGVGAACLFFMTALVYLSLRSPLPEVSYLQVQASPEALLVGWKTNSPTVVALHLAQGSKATPGQEVQTPLVFEAAGEHQLGIRDLTPKTHYLIQIKSPGGELLQRTSLSTPPRSLLPQPRLKLQKGAVILIFSGRYPVSVVWRAERRLEGEWLLYAKGGDRQKYQKHQEIPLSGILPGDSVRLTCSLLPSGEEQPTQVVLLEGESPLEARARRLLHRGEESEETFSQALESFRNDLRAQRQKSSLRPPRPMEHLLQAGFPNEIQELFRQSKEFLPAPQFPIMRKLELERLLLPLEDFDVFLQAFHLAPVFQLQKLRKRFLPFGSTSTLPKDAQEISEHWRSNFLVPDSSVPSRFLLTDSYLRTHYKHGQIRLLSPSRITVKMVETYLTNDRSSILNLHLPKLPPAEQAVELLLELIGYSRFHFLLVEINEQSPMVLWYQEGISKVNHREHQAQRLYFRLPRGLLRQGKNVLRFRVRTLSGEHGRMMPVFLVGLTLRGGQAS
jgi:serine/threonine-protein kinase